MTVCARHSFFRGYADNRTHQLWPAVSSIGAVPRCERLVAGVALAASDESDSADFQVVVVSINGNGFMPNNMLPLAALIVLKAAPHFVLRATAFLLQVFPGRIVALRSFI